jgi:hypothetical protein
VGTVDLRKKYSVDDSRMDAVQKDDEYDMTSRGVLCSMDRGAPVLVVSSEA